MPVADHPEAAEFLWRLLGEREPHESISHKKMPTWWEHLAFVYSSPYLGWWLIDDDGIKGAVYLTRNHEIGIGIFKSERGKGYASRAIQMVMEQRKGPFLANINPANHASLSLFRRLGFTGPIQVTLEHA